MTLIAGEMDRNVLAGANVKHVSNRGKCSLEKQVVHSVEAHSWQQRFVHIAACGAVGMSLTMAGCSNSPTNAAAQSASSASTQAAHYLATAGNYRPAKNFPDHFNKPLTASELRMREQSAMHNPSAFLARNGKGFTSSRRDIRHAIALLTNALDNSATSWQYKRVLYAQRAMCEDQLAGMKARQMQVDTASITRQLHALDYSTLHLTRYARKISYLTAEHTAYVHQYVSALHNARKVLKQSQLEVLSLSTRLHHSESVLKTLLAKRKAELIQGGRLEMQSTIQNGPQSLTTLKAGTRALDAAAAISVPIARAHFLVGHLRFVLSMAENRVAHAQAEVAELSSQRAISQKIAGRALDQLKLLQVAVRTIIYGSGVNQMDVNRSATLIKKRLAQISRDARKATKLYKAAAQDIEMAINSQRTAYTLAIKLMNEKMHRSDPLIQALENKTPEALLEILHASSTLAEARMLRTELMAKTLQRAAAELCQSTYGIIGKSSPITAPKAAYLAAMRKSVILKMDSATVALRQAKMNMTGASAKIKWLQPAFLYAVNMGIVGTSTESAMIAKAKAIADEAAKQADSINPELNLPLEAASR
ncbi:MAG: hypothetical protein ACP5O1_00360 [Phycisphaerae bacterium]